MHLSFMIVKKQVVEDCSLSTLRVRVFKLVDGCALSEFLHRERKILNSVHNFKYPWWPSCTWIFKLGKDLP